MIKYTIKAKKVIKKEETLTQIQRVAAEEEEQTVRKVNMVSVEEKKIAAVEEYKRVLEAAAEVADTQVEVNQVADQITKEKEKEERKKGHPEERATKTRNQFTTGSHT